MSPYTSTSCLWCLNFMVRLIKSQRMGLSVPNQSTPNTTSHPPKVKRCRFALNSIHSKCNDTGIQHPLKGTESPLAIMTFTWVIISTGSRILLAKFWSTKLWVLPLSMRTTTSCSLIFPIILMVIGVAAPANACKEMPNSSASYGSTSASALASSSGNTSSTLISSGSFKSTLSSKNNLGLLHLWPG